jgi:hypothetical protein
MRNTKAITHKIKLWSAVSIQLIFFPLSLTTPIIKAQEADTSVVSTENSASIPTQTFVEEPAPVVEQTITPGPQEPTGPENTSYTYNPESGLWENQYYTWSPTTKLTSPKTERTYSYNPATDKWDNTQYIFAPESNSYVPRTVSTPTNPTITANSIDKGDQSIPNLKRSNSEVLENPNYNIGPGALEVTSYDNENNGYFDNFFNANISVSVTSNAQSGDATVFQNTIGGSALTGNASVTANIMNLVQSTWGVGGLLPQMYTENIQGDYFGDILLDPGLLAVNSNNNSNNLIVNSTQDVAITNDIELNAQSGDALVQSNTQAGDASSGNATAILNLMNVINSSLSTGGSFLGMLNIHGNFDGDVLIPDNMIDSLLASNLPTSQIELGDNVDNSFILNNKNSHKVDNNIQATASSGDALVGMNTSAGDATSGSADTSVTVFNLVGNHIVADQALLVFVNVSGTWVGFITNAPNGSNSALLGGGVSTNTTQNDAEYNIDNSSTITNNVDLNATTGSASVIGNTTAGSALSGNANTLANITNISNSSFSLANWFGMLFINIFGNWNGSFGTDTAFGDTVTPTSSAAPTNNPITSSVANSSPSPQGVRVFSVSLAPNSSGGTSITSATPILEDDVPPPSVTADGEVKKTAVLGEISSNTPTSTGFNTILWGSALIGLIAFIIYRRRLATV